MLARLVAGLVLAASMLSLAIACGGDGADQATPEEVVRAWSDALNRGDNEAAADLFAPEATVSQPGYIAQLITREDALVAADSPGDLNLRMQGLTTGSVALS